MSQQSLPPGPGGSRAALFGVRQRGRVMERDFYIRERWKLLRPITPVDIGMDPCPASLYGVAAASASFPPFIGPISLKVGDEEVYWLTR